MANARLHDRLDVAAPTGDQNDHLNRALGIRVMPYLLKILEGRGVRTPAQLARLEILDLLSIRHVGTPAIRVLAQAMRAVFGAEMSSTPFFRTLPELDALGDKPKPTFYNKFCKGHPGSEEARREFLARRGFNVSDLYHAGREHSGAKAPRVLPSPGTVPPAASMATPQPAPTAPRRQTSTSAHPEFDREVEQDLCSYKERLSRLDAAEVAAEQECRESQAAAQAVYTNAVQAAEVELRAAQQKFDQSKASAAKRCDEAVAAANCKLDKKRHQIACTRNNTAHKIDLGWWQAEDQQYQDECRAAWRAWSTEAEGLNAQRRAGRLTREQHEVASAAALKRLYLGLIEAGVHVRKRLPVEPPPRPREPMSEESSRRIWERSSPEVKFLVAAAEAGMDPGEYGQYLREQKRRQEEMPLDPVFGPAFAAYEEALAAVRA